MRVAVYGTGGVGGYFGGRLAQAGEQVIFIARGEHLRAIQANGLHVESFKGNFTIAPAQALEDPAQVGIVDLVLVGVKAWQVPEAAQAMRPLVGAQTMVIPLQNGVDAPGQLAAVLDEAGQTPHVLGGMCQISSLVASPGVIRHAGIEPLIAFGELDLQARGRVETLQAAFMRAGVNAQVPADIRATMWNKFAFIASLSGVGAVTRAPVGVLRSTLETRRLLEQAISEIYAVGRALEVKLSEDTVARTLAFVDKLPETTTASMVRDILAGRPSELSAQNGAVVRMGQECGISTPAHAFLYTSLLPLELRARGSLHFA